MTDIFTSKKRSQIMAKIRGCDTRPEKLVRRSLRLLGIGFRSNVATLPGKPDIVLTKQKKAVFIHGCFWHGHKGCKRAALPSTNRAFWREKISANMLRDKAVARELSKKKWKTLVIWQCQLKKTLRLERRLVKFAKGA